MKGLVRVLSKGSLHGMLLDPLDGLDPERFGWKHHNFLNPYWCLVECSGAIQDGFGGGTYSQVEVKKWMLKCYICGQAWRESYTRNGGWYMWNPIQQSIQKG